MRATLKKGAFWNFQTGVSRSKIRGDGPLALLRPGDDPEAATRKLLREKHGKHGAFHDPLRRPRWVV
jgi:hypothetical protein